MHVRGMLVLLGLLLLTPVFAWTDPAPDELDVLQKGDGASNRTLVLNPKSRDSLYHWAAGASYTGFQLRYQFSCRWAVEGRAQFGSADSDYGKVSSKVFGIRGYRFFPFRDYLAWYTGGEVAYARAQSDTTSYETKGFAAGGFGGMEYRIAKRVSVGVDIGPYIISLRETQTQMTQTSLDFVVNTAINFYLFK
jgi:hypothetical protein